MSDNGNVKEKVAGKMLAVLKGAEKVIAELARHGSGVPAGRVLGSLDQIKVVIAEAEAADIKEIQS